MVKDFEDDVHGVEERERMRGRRVGVSDAPKCMVVMWRERRWKVRRGGRAKAGSKAREAELDRDKRQETRETRLDGNRQLSRTKRERTKA